MLTPALTTSRDQLNLRTVFILLAAKNKVYPLRFSLRQLSIDFRSHCSAAICKEGNAPQNYIFSPKS